MKFSHPLARSGSVWPATTLDDKAHDILVIVTTLELDARHKKFKASKVERAGFENLDSRLSGFSA